MYSVVYHYQKYTKRNRKASFGKRKPRYSSAILSQTILEDFHNEEKL